MKTMAHYLIIMFMIMLLIFRFIVLFTTVFGIDFPIVSVNETMEIGVIFISLLCIILFTKTKLIGGILYLVTSFIYYGFEFIKLIPILNNNSEISINQELEIIVLIIELAIAVFAFFILLYDKKQLIHPTDKKTDFFYKGNQYDREYDNRADKNNYRTM